MSPCPSLLRLNLRGCVAKRSELVPSSNRGRGTRAGGILIGGRCRRRDTGGRRSRLPFLLLGLDEFAIVWRFEVERRSARSEVLDETLANDVGGARREDRHRECGDSGPDTRDALECAGHPHRGGGRGAGGEHRSCKARDERFTSI